jgi:hypothetical protein
VQKNNDASKRRQPQPPTPNGRNERKKRSSSLFVGNVKQNVPPLWRRLAYSSNEKKKQKRADKRAERQKGQLPSGNLSLRHLLSVRTAGIQVGGERPLQIRLLPHLLALRLRVSGAPALLLHQNTGQGLWQVVVGELEKRPKPRKWEVQCLPE